MNTPKAPDAQPGHNGEDRADRQEAPARMVDVPGRDKT